MAVDTLALTLYIVIALLVAILYSLRKIYSLEYGIATLDVKIEKLLEHARKKKK